MLLRSRFTRILILRNSLLHVQKICASNVHTNPHQSFESKPSKMSLKLLHILPKYTQPYLRLIRLDRPTGFWLIYLPSAWGIATATLPGQIPTFGMLSLFAVGTLVMRGAACTINDLWDRDIDAKVARTVNRPLVNGEITTYQALVFLLGELSMGLAVLLQLNISSVVLGVSCMGLVLTYPAAKRTLKWPQVLLGFSVNWGVLLGYTAVADCLVLSTVLPIYAAAIFWTLFYDTIYAHLDKEDDLKLGINSTAISFGEDTHKWISVFGAGMISSLLLAGVVTEQSWAYYALIGAVGAHLGKQVFTLNVNDKEDCFRKFGKTFDVGVLVFLAIVLGNLCKKAKQEDVLEKVEGNREAISRFDDL